MLDRVSLQEKSTVFGSSNDSELSGCVNEDKTTYSIPKARLCGLRRPRNKCYKIELFIFIILITLLPYFLTKNFQLR